MDQLLAGLIGAVTGGTFTALGWLVVHRLAITREEHSRRQQATIVHLQRQIEELYGPLLGMVQQSRFIYDVALKLLPSSDEGIDASKFAGKDADVWNYLIENYLLPNSARIAELIRKNLHLLDGGRLPPSYEHLAKHQAQFECLHKLWREEGVDSTSIAGIGWPTQFEEEVERILVKLRREYSKYIGRSTFLSSAETGGDA